VERLYNSLLTLTPLARRGLAALWLAGAGLCIAGLAGELFLRIVRERAWKESERYRTGNIFFANSLEMNAGQRALWRKPWRKYEPGAKLELSAGGELFRIEINSQGYRTREFSETKPAGTVRVLCIGGSTTVAGRTNDETYPALLEARLRRRWPGLPLEVLNLGTSGVGSDLWLAWLDKLLAWQPDVVVQYEGINDISWLELPAYAARHPIRRVVQDSLLLERLLGFAPANLDPEISETLERRLEMHRRCRARDVAYLGATFAAPDAARASPEFRGLLDVSAEFWTRYFPLRRFALYSAVLARHNALFREFTDRHRINRVLVHEELTDPALFVDACHLTPEGIDRLAGVFEPAVADLVSDRPAFREWEKGAYHTALVTSRPGQNLSRGGNR
jgi:lysophospholipase L1-like esterase